MAELRFFASTRAAVNAQSLSAEAFNLPTTIDSDILREALAEAFPEAAQLMRTCTFLVDGERIGDRKLEVASLDTIDVLPPFAGG